MTYPPPPSGWQDPASQPSAPPADPATPVGQQIPTQPAPVDPYTTTSQPPVGGQQLGADPYSVGQPVSADPYPAGQPVSGYPVSADPYPAGQPVSGDAYKGAGPQPAAYPQPGYPQPGYPQPGYPGYGYPPAPRTNSLALAGMILSLIGFMSCITAPIGAILGHVARRQIKETGEGGAGMATTAIIVGWIVTGLLALVIIVYAAVIAFAISEGSSSSSY